MKINPLQASDIEGEWKAAYSTVEEGFDPNSDIEEQATITLKAGKVTGTDPFGGVYNGEYTLDEGKFNAVVKVTNPAGDGIPIFEGVEYPFTVDLKGDYQSPNYFSALGFVVEHPKYRFAVNCQRKRN